ncbi:hypothetical protein FQA39_LY09221 [Lamprigera yunnana]|nr:hypothetical protein FQA39_LY09221 [Lamprigera yunnana]
MSWTREQLIIIIDGYRKHPCLYAVKSKNYKNKHARTQALEEILKDARTAKPEVSILEIKNKFNALKTNFMMEHRKMQKSQRSGAGDEDIYVSSLWYFENFLFVLEHATPRASYDSIIVNKEVSETEASQDAEMELLLIDEDYIDEATAALVTPSSSNAPPTPTSYDAHTTSTAGAKQKKRKAMQSILHILKMPQMP